MNRRQLPQIDELNNQFEESLMAGNTYNLEKLQVVPSQNDWNMNTMNSDITKEIDALLNYKPHNTIIRVPINCCNILRLHLEAGRLGAIQLELIIQR